jgi:hypothetical protein
MLKRWALIGFSLIGVPVESVQETTIHGLTGEIVEKNEGLLPQMP